MRRKQLIRSAWLTYDWKVSVSLIMLLWARLWIYPSSCCVFFGDFWLKVCEQQKSKSFRAAKQRASYVEWTVTTSTGFIYISMLCFGNSLLTSRLFFCCSNSNNSVNSIQHPPWEGYLTLTKLRKVSCSVIACRRTFKRSTSRMFIVDLWAHHTTEMKWKKVKCKFLNFIIFPL